MPKPSAPTSRPATYRADILRLHESGTSPSSIASILRHESGATLTPAAIETWIAAQEARAREAGYESVIARRAAQRTKTVAWAREYVREIAERTWRPIEILSLPVTERKRETRRAFVVGRFVLDELHGQRHRIRELEVAGQRIADLVLRPYDRQLLGLEGEPLPARVSLPMSKSESLLETRRQWVVGYAVLEAYGDRRHEIGELVIRKRKFSAACPPADRGLFPGLRALKTSTTAAAKKVADTVE